MNDEFDTFLSHNSQDKPIVRELAQALRSRNLKVWLDEELLAPGMLWIKELETIIGTTRSALVLIGESGLGPWQTQEMHACLSEFVKRKLPVIPVFLPGADTQLELPLLLRDFIWVDLRAGLDEEGLDKLVWGITRDKSGQSTLNRLDTQIILSMASAPVPVHGTNQTTSANDIPDTPAIQVKVEPNVPLNGQNKWKLNKRVKSVPTNLPKDIAVPLRKELRGGLLQGAIVFDPAWKAIWPDLAIPIVNKTLRDLPQDEYQCTSEVAQWKTIAAQAGWLMLTPDDLFADSLTRLRTVQGESLEGLHPPGVEGYLLPLQPLALALLDTDGLRHSFRLWYDLNQGKPVAVLTLELFGGESLTLEKYYSDQQEDVKIIEPQSFLSQWPAYVSQEWRHYYLYAGGDMDMARIARAIVPRRLPDILAKEALHSVVSDLRSWAEQDNAQLLVDERPSPGIYGQIWLADRPIEAVMFKQCSGLCLVQNTSKEIPISDGDHQIAVDFGSSVTCILIQLAGRMWPSGPLDAPVLNVFSRDDVEILRYTFEFKGSEAVLLPSILSVRSEKWVRPSDTNIPHGATFIPALSALSNVKQDIFRQLMTGKSESWGAAAYYEFNFKHANRKHKNSSLAEPPMPIIEKYLAEACLLAAASAVGRGAVMSKVRWAFSYPATYLAHMQRSYIDCCNNAIARVNSSPLDGKGHISLLARHVVEPLAIYYYYRNLDAANVSSISIIIDVGNDFTGIGIFYRDKPIWFGSLALGRYHMLIEYFICNQHVLRDLVSVYSEVELHHQLSSALTEEIRRGNSNARWIACSRIEDLLSHMSNSPEELCSNIEANEMRENIARLFLCGITAYLSFVLGCCQNSERFDDAANLNIFVCGQGSLLINNFLNKAYVDAVCREFLYGAVSSVRSIRADFIDSREVRQEAARGLLYALGKDNWDNSIAQNLLDRSPMPLGEYVSLKGEPAYGPQDYLPSNQFKNPAQLDLTSLASFEIFLQKAQALGVKDIDYRQAGELESKTAALFLAECHNGGEALKYREISEGIAFTDTSSSVIQIQPPFILALRACIEMLIKR